MALWGLFALGIVSCLFSTYLFSNYSSLEDSAGIKAHMIFSLFDAVGGKWTICLLLWILGPIVSVISATQLYKMKKK